MGCGFGPHDGNSADQSARLCFGSFASGLSERLSAGFHRVRRRVSIRWLARDVFYRRCAGAAGLICACPRAGIAGMESHGEAATARIAQDTQAKLATLHLFNRLDDRVQLLLARNPGSLSDLPARTASLRSAYGFAHYHCPEYRSNLRRAVLWNDVGENRAPVGHFYCGFDCVAGIAALGVL